MENRSPSIFTRAWLALVCLFRVLFDGEFAREVLLLHERGPVPSGRAVEMATSAAGLLTGTPVVPTPAASPTPAELAAEAGAAASKPAAAAAPKPAAVPPAASPASPAGPAAGVREGALQILQLLQREGRLLDFCEEELAGYPDATVGAAARTVHAGCRKVLQQYVGVKPVRAEAEGAKVTLAAGFDAAAVRLTGNVVGSPPFTGTLRHHGWRAEPKLPEPARGEAAAVLAPAEVEL